MMLSLIQSATPLLDQRLVLPDLTWQQYESLLSTFGNYPTLRLTYLDGRLELFMPSPEHEMLKKAIARLLERYAEEKEIVLHGFGSATFRLEAKARGIEPDECYCIGTLKDLPDFAVEINLTSGGLDKLAVYEGLGIPEVLIWQESYLSLYRFEQGKPQVTDCSRFFPDLDWRLFAQYVRPQDQPQAIKDFLRAIS